MDWTEQIIAGLRWLKENPEVTWSGAGFTILGILYLVVTTPLTAIIRRILGKPPLPQQHDAGDWLAKNRHKLLARLQWELDERNKSLLLGQTTLHLDKDLSPDEVNHPHTRQDSLDYTLERDGKAVETTDQPIVDLFLRPDVGQRLAILGKPGSGKTVCLLKLLEHLLERAEEDAHEPLPVVFECSEWDGRELVPWMAYQLHRKYEMQEETARQMVQSRDILPLFDGLDELAAEKQGDFVRRFNALPNDRPQIVCCRIKEYEYLQENAGDKLALRNAVILRDIAPQRLKEHLLRAGLHDLWTLLEQPENEADPSSPQPAEEGRDTEQPQTLPELARRPLFLGIMIAVAEKLRQGWKRQQGESWEDLLWRLYLNDCLAQRPPQPKQEPDAHDRKYTKAPSRHWLHCLAKWMQAENKVALQIDELQPSILEGYWRFGLSYGLFYGIIIGLIGWFCFGPVPGYAVGLAFLLTICLPGNLALESDVRVLAGLAWGTFLWINTGLLSGLVGGLFIAAIIDNSRMEIKPIRSLHLPVSQPEWQTFTGTFFKNIFFSLTLGFIFGLIIGLIETRKGYLSPWPVLSPILMLTLGVPAGLALGLREIAGPIEKEYHPKQRLNEALSSSLALFPLFTLSGMLVFTQTLIWAEHFKFVPGAVFKMLIFYGALFLTAIDGFVVLGSNAILQHYLLRLCLRWERQIPLRLVPWLEAMHQRKVFQRVGGSYHFLHKQLQEYLAKQQAL